MNPEVGVEVLSEHWFPPGLLQHHLDAWQHALHFLHRLGQKFLKFKSVWQHALHFLYRLGQKFLQNSLHLKGGLRACGSMLSTSCIDSA
jgi:hypothetical protein